jgi:hypothetical protein
MQVGARAAGTACLHNNNAKRIQRSIPSMFGTKSLSANWSMVSLAAIAFAVFNISVDGQSTRPVVHVGGVEITGLPDDWTHHRVVYSNPGTEQQAIERGRYAEWLKTVNDPRYAIHQLKRGLPVQGPLAGDAAWIEAQAAANTKFVADQPAGRELRHVGPSPSPDPRFRIIRNELNPETDLNQDWNEPMGSAAAPSALSFPAKWSFDTTTASCANDFVVYPTGQLGSSSQASIIAYYNLYAGGCTGTVPETDWAYNTGGTVALAPVFSLSGSELAFIQTSGGVASLVLLQIPLTPPGTGTLGGAVSPNVAASASDFYTGAGCATPCMYSIALNGSTNDTESNPYYDYGSDTLWVGDSVGKLHEFTPVFNGAPAEVTTGWPIQLVHTATTDNNQVASPVYDSADGNVFVGSTTSVSTTTGGYLYSIDAATGTIVGASGHLDGTRGIVDAPLLDPTAGMLYVFAGRDASAGQAGLFQFSTSFTSGSGTEIQFGTGGTGVAAVAFDGTFDNTYYTSSNPASPSGYLYTCPDIGPPKLYQVPITGNVMGTPVVGPTVGGSGETGRCSPITEFYNSGVGGGTDLLLMSVFQGAKTGCTNSNTNGCVMSFNVTSPSSWNTSLTPLGAFNVSSPTNAAATTGISIDNASTIGGASQMYFLTQDTTGTSPCTGICAVQLSQSAP